MSTPSTVKPFGWGNEPPAWPKFLGIVIWLSVSVSPPAAAATSCSFATAASSDALMPSYCEPRLSIVSPAALWHFPLLHVCAPPGPSWNVWAFLGGEPAFGGPGLAPVTVTSVPTPYSELSTSAWAFFTPAEAAFTVTTRPTPSARPSAMKMAWRIRRRSSRRRYVTKNMCSPIKMTARLSGRCSQVYESPGCAAVTRGREAGGGPPDRASGQHPNRVVGPLYR